MYCIDLDSSRPEVLELPLDVLRHELELSEYGSLSELIEAGGDYDRKIFENERDAESYLARYRSIYDRLDNSWLCYSRQLPSMLYKRRYIVQTLMGEKNQTFRHYRKNWKRGTLFNLHDQTFFLTVRLLKLSETQDGMFRYDFELWEGF